MDKLRGFPRTGDVPRLWSMLFEQALGQDTTA